jgi:hypothetical protein
LKADDNNVVKLSDLNLFTMSGSLRVNSGVSIGGFLVRNTMLSVTGDSSFSGNLTSGATPTASNHLVTKSYVDSAVTTLENDKRDLTDGVFNMTDMRINSTGDATLTVKAQGDTFKATLILDEILGYGGKISYNGANNQFQFGTQFNSVFTNAFWFSGGSTTVNFEGAINSRDYRVTGGRPLGTTQINMRQARLENNGIFKADWLSFNSVLDENTGNVIYRLACMEKITLQSACISFDKTSYIPTPTVVQSGQQYRAHFGLVFYKDTTPTFRTGTFEYGVYSGVNAIPNAGGNAYLGEVHIRTGYNDNLSCQSYIDSLIEPADNAIGITWNRGDCVSCFMTVDIENTSDPETGTFNYSNIQKRD